MGKKKAKRTKTPLEKKKPRGGERVDAVGNLLIAWRIQDLDPEGGWGWQDVSRATVVERILYKLAHFETMTFPDIERAVKGSHNAVSYTHLRAHETDSYLVCRLLLEKKKKNKKTNTTMR